MNANKFKTFLRSSGAEVLDPTNPYELVRFRTENGVSVMYTGRRGNSFTGEAQEAWDAMQSKNTWTIMPNGLKEKKRKLALVRSRDGDECFYCGKQTDDNSRSLEHILAVEHGGNNSAANLVIACKPCNQAVGHSPIIEKIKYRDSVIHKNGGQS